MRIISTISTGICSTAAETSIEIKNGIAFLISLARTISLLRDQYGDGTVLSIREFLSAARLR